MCDDRPLFLYNAQKNLSSRFEAMLTLSIDLSTATHINVKSILLIFDEDVLIHNTEASRAIRGHEQVNSRFCIRKALFAGSRSGCLQIGSFCALQMGYRCNPIAFRCKKCENPLETPVCACYDPCEKTTKEASPMDSCDKRNVHTTMDTDRASGVRVLPLLK